jgi:hypothetical protein
LPATIHLDKTFINFSPESTYKDSKLRAQTGLYPHQIEKLREQAAKEDIVFIVNESDLESVVDTAKLIKTVLPEAQVSDKEIYDFSNIESLEDLISAYSFNEQGKIDPHGPEARKLLFESVLGKQESLDILKNKFEQQKKLFPPNLIYQSEEYQKSYAGLVKDYLTRKEQRPLNSSEEISLADFQNNLDRLDEFIKEYSKNNQIEIPQEVIDELDKHVAIHMTSYYPKLDAKSNEWQIETHSFATGKKMGRLTVHFSIDGVATAGAITMNDHWKEKPYAVICPLGQLVKKNGPMSNFLSADTYWITDPNSPGIKLPETATIIANKPDSVHPEVTHGSADDMEDLRSGHRGPDINIVKANKNAEDSIDVILKNRYGVDMKPVGNRGWTGEINGYEEQRLGALLKKIFPGLHRTLHVDNNSADFENLCMHFFERATLADNKEEIRKDKEKVKNHWSSQPFKFDELMMQTPEQIVESAKKALMSGINFHFNTARVSEDREDCPTKLPREFAHQLVKLGII